MSDGSPVLPDQLVLGQLLLGKGERWLALAKPSGLPVFPPHRRPDGDCLLVRLLSALPEQARPDWPPGFDGGILHRLDIATSGLILAARSPAALLSLRRMFADRALTKRYLLLSHKQVGWDRHRVDAPLAHDRRRKARMVVQRGRNTPHRGQWLTAETRLQRVGHTAQGLTAWQATMQTGVMHQIRVHAAFAGLALAGDGLYGGGPPTPQAQAYADATGLPRPPFHLHHLGMSGPDLEPPQAPLPSWWPDVLGAGA